MSVAAPATPQGRIVQARIKRIAPTGLVIDLQDGREGLVREREIAWDARARKGWRTRYPPGETVEVILIKAPTGALPEYSIRLAKSDPWLQAGERYAVGEVVEGCVTGIMPYGVFVELEPGISGLLHKAQFPVWERREPGEVFWPGDLVKVQVTQVDTEGRRVNLSMQGLASRRWQQMPLEPGRPRQARKGGDGVRKSPSSSALPLENLLIHGAKTVLVADDHRRKRDDIAEWLRLAGQYVFTAADGEEAVRLAQEKAPHLAIVDVNMPKLDGFGVVRRIEEVSPLTQCVLITGENNIEQFNADLAELLPKGVRFFPKQGLYPEDVLALLDDGPEIVREQPRTKGTDRVRRFVPGGDFSLQVDLIWMGGLLDRLRAATHANSVVLFTLDLASRQTSAVAQAGRPSLRMSIIPDLIHSPVRDVAEGGTVAKARDLAEAQSRRFLHLYDYVRFAACVGVPAIIANSNPYALFVFFDEPPDNLEMVEAQALLTAEAVTAKLESHQLMARTTGLHRQAMIGQLTDLLTHELNNQRDFIPRTHRLLQDQLRTVQKYGQDNPVMLPGALADVESTILDFTKELGELTKTVERLSGLNESEQAESVILSDIVEEAVNLLGFMARNNKIKIEINDMTKLSYMRTIKVSVRQVLVNVIVNAILQIRDLARGQQGLIRVILENAHVDDSRMYRIFVEDDGPGIHRRDWERIFDIGVTTRKGGRGLGLYISRKILEPIDGRVYVGASHILWGSQFVIELPSLP